MKKITKMVSVFAVMVMAISVTACSSQKQADNSDLLRVYTYNAEDIIHCSSVLLNDDGTFVFNFSAISDYIGHGEYTIQNDVVTLFTEDGQYHYTFQKKGDKLIFDAEHSSDWLWYGAFSDGSVFE